ncbi:hypothetical protein CWC16_00940 [Pseudoalteromonas sp. S3776]|uniref:Uncharacterized protein n=1 Tax=Pseudoalteromonas undina TaxID=43660 RepID=A0ACC6QYL2_9GAMM|nr:MULTISPECIES: hypothetical protein [unclassified Pseudoalteromonas]KPZ58259.1 hypothetical protein AN393_00067 [Pseudoalteromonas sp. P1-25]KPZ60417.1 hypothetical protein AN391_00029 [Pseudoalteromonas sp. P1-13-1a]KPZ62792.1 hypothetical protein AN389_00029 [Pseudoalteromonas sp. P1-7a]TMO76886.1 hypothetical protein CWC17_02815 [Pseudoalteromonas sp. S3785]TMO82359.1 hypothetical protein CWC16_00940 [Pseudoalteromonas sp. S3776]
MQAPLHIAPFTKNRLAGLFKAAQSYRVLVFLRFFIAIFGGYAFTSACISLLSVVLPIPKQDAVLLCVSISILIYALVFIYAFAIKSLKTVWISILLSSGFFVVVLALLKGWL